MQLINWPVAARAKYAALREIFDMVKDNPRPPSEFIAQGGALAARTRAVRSSSCLLDERGRRHADWRRWPQEWQGPKMPAVVAFASTSAQGYCHHLADSGLHVVSSPAQTSGDVGMRVGLIADLAIGMDLRQPCLDEGLAIS